VVCDYAITCCVPALPNDVCLPARNELHAACCCLWPQLFTVSDRVKPSAGNKYSDAVDIFDARSGLWSKATLSVARGYLAATSLPNQGLAIFAGGISGTSCCCLSSVLCRKCCS
jgi:hypothetical protein